VTNDGQAPGSTAPELAEAPTPARGVRVARVHLPIAVTPAQVAAGQLYVQTHALDLTARLLAALQEENRQLRLLLGGFVPEGPGLVRPNQAYPPPGQPPNTADGE
jgi:hypothetical protein